MNIFKIKPAKESSIDLSLDYMVNNDMTLNDFTGPELAKYLVDNKVAGYDLYKKALDRATDYLDNQELLILCNNLKGATSPNWHYMYGYVRGMLMERVTN